MSLIGSDVDRVVRRILIFGEDEHNGLGRKLTDRQRGLNIGTHKQRLDFRFSYQRLAYLLTVKVR